MSDIFYLLTLLLSYILHRAPSVQWVGFNQASCVAQDQIFKNVLYLRRQDLMYTEHCSNLCSSSQSALVPAVFLSALTFGLCSC